MKDEAVRQHHRMAEGEDVSGQASGTKTRPGYAGGGSVHHGSHGHSKTGSGHGSHGHGSVESHHPKGHHGGHKHRG